MPLDLEDEFIDVGFLIYTRMVSYKETTKYNGLSKKIQIYI